MQLCKLRNNSHSSLLFRGSANLSFESQKICRPEGVQMYIVSRWIQFVFFFWHQAYHGTCNFSCAIWVAPRLDSVSEVRLVFSVYSLLQQLLIILLTVLEFFPFSCMLTVDISRASFQYWALASLSIHLVICGQNTLVNTEYALAAWSCPGRVKSTVFVNGALIRTLGTGAV